MNQNDNVISDLSLSSVYGHGALSVGRYWNIYVSNTNFEFGFSLGIFGRVGRVYLYLYLHWSNVKRAVNIEYNWNDIYSTFVNIE